VASKWREWIKDRFGLKPIAENVVYRRVAKGAWYFGDGATLLFLLGVLVATGAFMTLTYSPSPDAAYASVRYITEHQRLGWFVRGLHYWSAGLMVVMLFFHLFRQLLVGGYKFPREGTWLIGVFLFFAVLTMAFTGYVLRWDERAVYAVKVVLTMFYYVPLIGEPLVIFVQGGEEIGALTLTRMFSVHVIFVPLLLLFLVGYHLFLVMYHGITSPTERKNPVHSTEQQKKIYKEDAYSEERGEDFYPVTAAKSGTMAMVVFSLVLGLTLIVGPGELQPEANLTAPAFPAEEWWYWWVSGLIALLPPAIAPAVIVALPIVIFLGLVLLPFLDRGPARGIRNRPFWAIFVVICVIGLLYLTDYRRKSPFTGWPLEEPPPLPVGIEVTEQVEEGRILFARYGCNSCHPVAGVGRRVAIDIAELSRRSREEIEEFILQPPEGIAMPAFRGRISEEDLARVVEFCHVVQTFPREQR
jgi:ubiquinol-cytochrome c reductase cytochrome b subunit